VHGVKDLLHRHLENFPGPIEVGYSLKKDGILSSAVADIGVMSNASATFREMCIREG
jgi:hypothetical protein